jgi:hypothetical protein
LFWAFETKFSFFSSPAAHERLYSPHTRTDNHRNPLLFLFGLAHFARAHLCVPFFWKKKFLNEARGGDESPVCSKTNVARGSYVICYSSSKFLKKKRRDGVVQRMRARRPPFGPRVFLLCSGDGASFMGAHRKKIKFLLANSTATGDNTTHNGEQRNQQNGGHGTVRVRAGGVCVEKVHRACAVKRGTTIKTCVTRHARVFV